MLLRALTPEDAARCRRSCAGCRRARATNASSPRSPSSPPKQLERITAGAGLSLGAFDAARRLVGLAEYARARDGEAEFGVVIADDYQGRGLGARLVGALLEHAKRSGIARLAGVTRPATGRCACWRAGSASACGPTRIPTWCA